MQTNIVSVGWPRTAAFVLGGLAAASVVFWVLKTSGKPLQLNTPAAASGTSTVIDPVALSRALGGGRTPVASSAPSISLSARFSMVGVVADSQSGGAALIAVDGAPPRPYRVGATVADGLVLQSVKGRVAALAAQRDGPVVLTLELPPLKR